MTTSHNPLMAAQDGSVLPSAQPNEAALPPVAEKTIAEEPEKAAIELQLDSHYQDYLSEKDYEILRQSAERYGMTGQQISGLVNDVLAQIVQTGGAASGEDIKAVLGDQADQVMARVKHYVEHYHHRGIWNEDDYMLAQAVAADAQGLRWLDKLFQQLEKTAIIPAQAQTDTAIDEKHLETMVADPRYDRDVGYRQQVAKAFADYYRK